MPPTNQTLSGHIYDEYDAPVANAKVTAFNKNLRTEKLLAEVPADAQGFYKINYLPVTAGDGEYQSADVFLRVNAIIDGNSQTGESVIHFNVPEDYVLDFKFGKTAYKGMAEFDRLVALLQPILTGQGVELGGLDEEEHHDISFLSGETGWNKDYISFLNTAYLFSRQIQVVPDIFYGLFRMGFPVVINELLMIKADSIKKAIHQAIDENIISSKWEKGIDKIIITLNSLSVKKLMDGTDEQSVAFKKLFGAALSVDQQKIFTATYFDNEEQPEKFWESLGTKSGFTDGKAVENAKQILRINQLTGAEPALTSLLYKEGDQDPDLKELRGFAKFTKEDWKSRISQLVTSGELKDFPVWVTGDKPKEKIENYASSLDQLVRSLFPTTVFSKKLAADSRDPFGSKPDLITFFSKNPDFDLQTNRINKLFDEANYEGVNDSDRVKADLKRINLLSKLSPGNYASVSALSAENLDSATAIVQKYSPIQFREKFAATIGAEAAIDIYRNAVEIDKLSTAVALGIQMSNDINVYAINGDRQASADYQSMFGDNMLCDCEHCSSVYSPAAYLVDILRFVQWNNDDAYDALKRRRQDIEKILLTCKNTNTPLPYIDLVNEILENTIAPQSDEDGNSIAYQTTNLADELAAYPEHINPAAYEVLRNANSSFNLPLNLPLEETRLYLDKSGFKRYNLMELFFGKNGDSKYSDIAIAAEYLQLSKEELELINGTTVVAPPVMNSVSEFLQSTDLTYIELLQLLESYFINPLIDPLNTESDRTVKIVAAADEDPATCAIDKLIFSGATAAANKINPFLRLWKKTKWDILDLDRVFTAFDIKVWDMSAEEKNSKLIIPLSHISRIKAAYNLSVPHILALWTPTQIPALWTSIDIAKYYDRTKEGQPEVLSLYKRLFQNKQVTNPVDSAFSNPSGLTGTLSEKAQIIIAALNISQQDFDVLNTAPFTNGNLTLENLSVLFRYATLARAMKMTIGDLISVIDLTGIYPFGNRGNTKDVLTLTDKVSLIRSSGFSLNELAVLVGKSAGAVQQPEIKSIAELLVSLREGLKKINLLFPIPAGITDEEESVIRQNKIENQNSFIADTLSTSFKTESKLVKILINDLVKSPADNALPAITPFIDDAFINSEEALFSLNEANEVSWTFPALFAAYNKLSETWNRISGLISKFKISVDEFLYLQKNATVLNIAGIWNLPADVPGSNLYSAFENLFNIIRFKNALVNRTPDWYKLFDNPIANETDSKTNFISLFADLNNSTVTTLEFLFGAGSDVNMKGALNFTFPVDYFYGACLLNVINCAGLSASLGNTANNIFELTKHELSADDAQLARSILKSKYDETAWLSIIKPISNLLRVKKRVALVSYILTAGGLESFRNDNNITSTNSLFEYFLIDVEMDVCMITSRIKQAISSVQLFIDRCLMNLEKAPPEEDAPAKVILLGSDFALQWNKWRKLYRVWEANRKIFLYPENWIEPELRDDKSPFFKELESKLRQNDVTDETAKDALLGYLEKLDTVANLEMVGLFPDEGTGIVHVIGRTKNIPHLYFYRKQEKNVWTAWEKMDVDIEGDHILPVVWNNRLIVFWGIFTEKQDSSGGSTTTISNPNTNTSGDLSMNTPQPVTYLEMKLAWSEYKTEKWGGKKISKEVCTINLLSKNFFPELSIRMKKDNEDHVPDVDIPVDPGDDGENNNGIDEVVRKVDVNHCFLSTKINNDKLYIRLLQWDNLGPERLYYKASFVFDDCSSSPKFKNDENGAFVIAMQNVRGNDLFLTSPHDFRLSGRGFFNSMVSGTGLTVFNLTPLNVTLLPSRDKIEYKSTANFFYSNSKNIFYGKSYELFDDIVINDIDSLSFEGVMARRIISTGNNLVVNAMSETHSAARTGILSLASSETNSDSSSTSEIMSYSILRKRTYSIQAFQHPYVCEFIKILNSDGIDGLYKKAFLDADGEYKEGIQNKNPKELFADLYNPEPSVKRPYPVEEVDFNFIGSYSIYNWELFFHIPLLMATRLSQNQKFDEARKWFHYIFDPTKSSSTSDAGAERFWITQPFRKEIENGVLTISDLINDTDYASNLEVQLDNWKNNPFNPPFVARLRPSAYMRSTVMKYIDNLIAWGDNLFQRDTIESINEATLLYVLAANMLGKKPEKVPARAIPQENSYSTIEDVLDSFGNAKVEIQSFLSPNDANDETTDDQLLMPLFCTPKNDLLLGYWDTVADRLFKIRHCMNIQGVVRQLPLFEPPIDPALLVRATAAGLDLNTILNDMTSTLPNYRFQVMLQKANELCSDVKGLGNELLSALEKQDAEQFSLIRSGHEIKMLELMRDIKVGQRDEAKENLESVISFKRVVEERKEYYSSRGYMNSSEETYFTLTQNANKIQLLLEANSTLASISYLIPATKIGSGFTLGVTVGGPNLGSAAMAAIEGGRSLVSFLRTGAEMANLKGTYQRRKDDWDFQAKTAELELKQIDKQIAAAEIRLAVSEKDLENHDVQMENAKEVDNYMRSKFTNAELYDYMVGQISSTYFQSYQLAYTTAKKAEKCFQYELGVEDTSFIQFGYWDSLKKGLLSGAKLQYDLRRLENAYLEQNTRAFEITKHISLANLNANSIMDIRRDGVCSFQIPELVFEMDFPGHYFRRIKSVAVSIPCIAGPYTSVSSQLSLKRSFVRSKDDDGTLSFDFLNIPDFSDPSTQYREADSGVKAIATSNGQGDTGMFEFNFRDERYLPFEGAGVIGEWNLELPTEARQFDYNSISDVIITVRYTAKESGNSTFKPQVNTKIRTIISESIDRLNNNGGLYKLLSLKNDFPDEFHGMKSDTSTTPVTKKLKIDKMFFPYFTGKYNMIFKSCTIFNKDGTAISFPITVNNAVSETIDDNWELSLTYNSMDIKNQEDVYLLINYSLTNS